MRLTISHRSAVATILASCTARVFLMLALDHPTGHNGAWISALIGVLPVALLAPGLAALRRLASVSGSRSALLRALALPFALLDASACVRAISRSAGYLSLDRMPAVWLALPVGLAAYWCVRCNGEAVAHGAMAWARLFPALMIVVMALQARHLRPQWLAPVLGDGWQSVVTGGWRAAGCALSASAVLLVSDPAKDGRGGVRSAAVALGGSAFLAAGLLLLCRMMTPTMPLVSGWLNRLDAILTNGRAPLYLQLPLIIMWYAGLLHLLGCACFACAALLQRFLPRLDGRVCALFTAFAACALSQTAIPESMLSVSAYAYLAAAALPAAALGWIREGRTGRCSSTCA